MMQPILFCNCQPTIWEKSREVDKAFIYKENGSFIECYNIYFEYKIIVNDKVDRKW